MSVIKEAQEVSFATAPPGSELVCVVPKELGEPKNMYIRNGRLVIETVLGHHMIVHKDRREP